jgi:hypothetical protein
MMLAPGHASADTERVGDQVRVLDHRRGRLDPAREEHGVELTRQHERLFLRLPKATRLRVVLRIAGRRLGRQPLRDVPGLGLGAGR